MIPELGKYMGAVLSSYGISLLLIAILVAMSLARSRKVKAQLEEVEARRKPHG